jgi:ankyrin repeat protein
LDGSKFLNVKNSEGKTPLHEAAQFLQFDVVKFLIDQNADRNVGQNVDKTVGQNVVEIDALKRADWTPLMLAATRTGEDAAKVRLG